MIELRPYQQDAVSGVSKAFLRTDTPLLVLPTGGGKTVIFSYLSWRIVTAGKRVMILAHRDELLEQIWQSLRNFKVSAQIVAGGMPYDQRYMAHVASVFTIARRLGKIAVPDWLIIDEAHHVTPNTVWGRVIAALRELNPKLKILGVTATPCRLSGEGLGETFGEMVLGPTPAELIDDGWLSKYRMFGPPAGERVDMSQARGRSAGDWTIKDKNAAVDKPRIYGSAVKHYQAHCPGRAGLAFCPSVESAQHTAEAFSAAGFSALSIDGKMEKRLRRQAVRDFSSGQLQVLTSCALVSEGFDVPGIVAAFLLNPTLSTSKCLQEYGRALRPAPGKAEALIFDHVGNSMTHGLPDDDREWTLAGTRKKKKSDVEDFAVKQCPRCYMVLRPSAVVCPGCGNKFTVKPRAIETVEGELSEVDIAAARRIARFEAVKERTDAKTFEDLVALGKEKGYKPNWATHVHLARQKKAKTG